MAPRKSTMYLIINKINGKRYVGITRSSLKKRRYEHIWFAQRGSAFAISRALRKHGSDNFIFVSIGEFNDWNEAQKAEIKFIEVNHPEYNMTSGGDGIRGLKWTKERRERSIIGLRKSWTEERKKIVSQKLKGKPPSKLAIQRWKEAAPLLAKVTVVCLNDGFFGKVKEAAERYGIRAKSISSVCNGDSKAGYRVRRYFFVKSDHPLSETQCREEMNRRLGIIKWNRLAGARARKKAAA